MKRVKFLLVYGFFFLIFCLLNAFHQREINSSYKKIELIVLAIERCEKGYVLQKQMKPDRILVDKCEDLPKVLTQEKWKLKITKGHNFILKATFLFLSLVKLLKFFFFTRLDSWNWLANALFWFFVFLTLFFFPD